MFDADPMIMVGLNMVPVLVVPYAAKLVVLCVAYYGRSLWFVFIFFILWVVFRGTFCVIVAVGRGALRVMIPGGDCRRYCCCL